jgi:deazaflavin-dependent oxidoreductase (nitroreductase family)
MRSGQSAQHLRQNYAMKPDGSSANGSVTICPTPSVTSYFLTKNFVIKSFGHFSNLERGNMNQKLLDRIRVINKYFTNNLLIHISGKKFGHFAILSHVGRKTGKLYKIPVIAEPFNNGFVIALTYGKKVDWYANVMAKGSCSVYWKEKKYFLVNPEFISKETGGLAFPPFFRSLLRKIGIQYFLKLEIQS